ncbi:aminotransferase DegT [Desulfobacteraceae bacterium SEEP-SAG9]|nr:aminotransferase DegT [Desulfobacteraceae bacterium SEEP-SAG9]
MQFVDLAAQQRKISTQIEKNIHTVLSHGNYIMGPEVKELENKLGTYVGARFAIGCSSGTDALLLALMAYNIGPGDVIFTSPFTFIATAEVICLLGATPVFVDIDDKTFNIHPEKLLQAILALKNGSFKKHPLPKIPELESLKPKGIIAVDLFGLPAEYDQINKIAGEHSLFVIEDAAQSFGAEYKRRNACNLADIACTSFFPAKPLGCYGDGGMCFTNNENTAEIVRSLCVHGKGLHKYDNIRIGLNGRLDTLQAAILLAKFSIFREENLLRQDIARRYAEFLSVYPSIQTPIIPEVLRSAWAQYSILVKDKEARDSIQAKLKTEGIPSAVYYPKPLHIQEAFSFLGHKKGDFPISEDCSRRIISLPMHPYLTLEEQEQIAQVIGNV